MKLIRDIRASSKNALLASGIQKRITFHTLRHTFCSHLVMSGTDLNTVRDLMGHKSLDVTMRYSHLNPHHKKHAIDRMDEKLRQAEENRDSEEKRDAI